MDQMLGTLAYGSFGTVLFVGGFFLLEEPAPFGGDRSWATVKRVLAGSRFRRPEHALYALFMLWIFFRGTAKAVQASARFATLPAAYAPGGPLTHGYPSATAPGTVGWWLHGAAIDLSDTQWRQFRDNLPLLLLAVGAFLGGRRMLPRGKRGSHIGYNILGGLGASLVLYGAKTAFVLALLLLNYAVAKAAGGLKRAPLLIWAVNMAILVSNELHDGYRWATLSSSLRVLDGDAYNGLLRWHVAFNLSTLRMISFALDYHWAVQSGKAVASGLLSGAPKGPSSSQKQAGKARSKLRLQAESPLPKEDYSLGAYLSYALYFPLLLAGPVISFNAFSAQLRDNVKGTSSARERRAATDTAFGYGMRLLLVFVSLELMSRCIYSWGIMSTEVGQRFFKTVLISDLEAALYLHFYSLKLIYLKFVAIWRFFRLVAMLDGIVTPENLPKDITAQYSILGFWRHWHQSFNVWLIRYLYVPLGGRGR